MTTHPTAFRFAFILVLGLILVSGCSSESGQKTAQKKEAAVDTGPVKVGIILPLTGTLSEFGEIEKRSFDMALEEINDRGGIHGRPLEFLFEDTMGSADAGRSAVEELIAKDKVVMIGGGYSSSVTYAAASVAQQNKIPFLINTASEDKITEQGWDHVFRLNPPASEYPKAIKSFLTEVVKPGTAALLFENSQFGMSSSKEFKALCSELGIEIVFEESYGRGQKDFRPLLSQVKAMNPDIVYMVSYALDAALLMKHSAEIGLEPRAFIGGGAGFTLPEFQEATGKAGNHVFSATLWYQTLPYPGAKKYFDDFTARYNMSTEYHGAEAYAATFVMADALKRAKSLAAEDVRQALAETDMLTVFGPVRFVSYEKKTNQNKADAYMVQWIEGKLELVWPLRLASKKYVFPVPYGE